MRIGRNCGGNKQQIEGNHSAWGREKRVRVDVSFHFQILILDFILYYTHFRALGNIVKGPAGKPGHHHHHHHSSSSQSASSPANSPSSCLIGKAEGSPELETISEDEQLQHRSPSTSISSSGDGRTHRKKQSSLSQSAREKRLELRECKAKVDYK